MSLLPAPLPEVTVCTPWYPTAYNRLGGSFVADWSALSRRLATRLRVVHAEEWPGGTAANVARWSADTERVFDAMAARRAFDVAGRHGTITRVPTVLTSGMDVPERAEAAVEATRRLAPTLADSPVVHGHVGYLGGLVAARLAHPDARVVVTEHSTGLADVLASERGLALYAEVLTRAHRLTCVSAVVRDQIHAALPEHADKVVVVPNPVDFDAAPRRADRPGSLDRWVFAGGLIERKGVVRLVEAFARFAAERGSATLDLYGAGALEQALRERVQEAGLAERVAFRGAVGHGELLAALPSYDVLLAPSTFETFHLVVPEAVAAGLPVVVTRSGGPQEALAGVADQVGQFVDVNDDPAELHAAVLGLESRLGELDLDGARTALSARYGPEAVLASLADLYGAVTDTGTDTGTDTRTDTGTATGAHLAAPAATPDVPTDAGAPARPESVTLLSCLGWRRYAIESEAATAAVVGLPLSVVTDDQGVRDALPLAEHVASRDFLAGLARPSSSPPRGVLGRLRRAAAGPQPANSPRRGTHVLTHVSGSVWAAALVAADPGAHLVVELDRARLGLDPVDAP